MPVFSEPVPKLPLNDAQDVVVSMVGGPCGRPATAARCAAAWRRLGAALHAPPGATLPPVPQDRPDERAAGTDPPAPVALLPHLADLARFAGDRPVLVASADLYPALSPVALAMWLAQAPAVALTRQDCALVEAYDPLAPRPFRGGIDAVLLTAPALRACLAALAELSGADELSLPGPCALFVLGALAGSDPIGGLVLDSAVLLHETCPAPPFAVAPGETAAARAVLARLARTDGQSARAAVLEAIGRECAANAPFSQDVARIALMVPEPPPLCAHGRSIAARLAALCPFLLWQSDMAALCALVARQLEPGGDDPQRARALLVQENASAHAFAQLLAATLLQIECRALAAAKDIAPPLRLAGPDAPASRPLTHEGRFALAERFSDTLLLEGIFDTALHEALTGLCHNTPERLVLAALAAHAVPGATGERV